MFPIGNSLDSILTLIKSVLSSFTSLVYVIIIISRIRSLLWNTLGFIEFYSHQTDLIVFVFLDSYALIWLIDSCVSLLVWDREKKIIKIIKQFMFSSLNHMGQIYGMYQVWIEHTRSIILVLLLSVLRIKTFSEQGNNIFFLSHTKIWIQMCRTRPFQVFNLLIFIFYFFFEVLLFYKWRTVVLRYFGSIFFFCTMDFLYYCVLYIRMDVYSKMKSCLCMEKLVFDKNEFRSMPVPTRWIRKCKKKYQIFYNIVLAKKKFIASLHPRKIIERCGDRKRKREIEKRIFRRLYLLLCVSLVH